MKMPWADGVFDLFEEFVKRLETLTGDPEAVRSITVSPRAFTTLMQEARHLTVEAVTPPAVPREMHIANLHIKRAPE